MWSQQYLLQLPLRVNHYGGWEYRRALIAQLAGWIDSQCREINAQLRSGSAEFFAVDTIKINPEDPGLLAVLPGKTVEFRDFLNAGFTPNSPIIYDQPLPL